jgi:hypothetical protein
MATLVQIAKSAIKQSVGGAAITTDAIDTTGADFLLAAVSAFASSNIGLTDNKGNTWTALDENSGSSNIRWFYCNNPSSVGSGHTVTPSSASFPSAQLFAYSGAKNATPLIDADINNGTTNNPTLSSGLGATYDRSLIASAVCFNNAVTFSAVTDLAIENQAVWSSGNAMGLATASVVTGTGSVISAGLTSWTASGSTTWGISSVVFASEDSVEIASAEVRVTQETVETLASGVPSIRVSQVAVETLTLPAAPNIRVSQLVVETLVLPSLNQSVSASAVASTWEAKTPSVIAVGVAPATAAVSAWAAQTPLAVGTRTVIVAAASAAWEAQTPTRILGPGPNSFSALLIMP